MSGQFDFREGMLLEKVVYKDTSCDWKSRCLYALTLITTWAWGVAWFALFFYLYIFHQKIAFWIYIAVWLVFAISLIVNAIIQLQSAKSRKLHKKQMREEHLEKEKEIERARQQKMIKEKAEKEGITPEKDKHTPLNTEMESLNA